MKDGFANFPKEEGVNNFTTRGKQEFERAVSLKINEWNNEWNNEPVNRGQTR